MLQIMIVHLLFWRINVHIENTITVLQTDPQTLVAKTGQ